MDIEHTVIKPEIQGLALIENFLTEDEENTYLKEIDNFEWNNSLSRRTQHYGFVYNYTNKVATETLL
jgi:hypothetical protein